MVAIIDYAAGNVRSVENALLRLGADVIVTSDSATIIAANHVVLPGVGHAGRAMESLAQSGLVDLLKSLTQPVLGICVGMQLMCRMSQEGGGECLGIFDSYVRKIPNAEGVKIPHTGWDRIENLSSPLFKGINDGQFVYYVHSYAPEVCAHTIATTSYSCTFSGALARDNFYGTQFHPEKSGELGERILKNFLDL